MISNAEVKAMRAYRGETAAEIDCTFEAAGGDSALRCAIRPLRQEAGEAVRRGCPHVILSDAAMDAERAAIPMILATGAVHSHLVRQQLRTFTSLNVRSGECLDVHYFAVLIGVGATTVNAYLAQETIADRHRRGLFPGGAGFEAAIARYKSALN